jgi:hypothetical protein
MLKTTLRLTCYETTLFCTTFSDSTSLVRPNKKGPGKHAGAFFITYLFSSSTGISGLIAKPRHKMVVYGGVGVELNYTENATWLCCWRRSFTRVTGS